MGEVVLAACLSHAPGMTGLIDHADPGRVQRLKVGLTSLRDALERARPDAVVGVSSEHFTNFFLSNLPAFAVGTASVYECPADAGLVKLLRIDPHEQPGHAELGRDLLAHLLLSGFDPALVAGSFGLDENFAVPLHLLAPTSPPPLVPVIVNAVAPPFPTLRRCWDLGLAIGTWLRQQTLVDRVALIGTGGLSHWVGVARTGDIDVEFDRRVLDRFGNGRARELADLTQAELEAAGNGANELRAWLAVAAAVDSASFQTLAYEPVPQWSTGIAITQAVLGGVP